MMNDNEDNGMSTRAGIGILTGLAVSTFAHASRYDDTTQRRIRDARFDAKDALGQIRDLNSRGEVLRARMEVVQDAQVGLSIARAHTTFPEVVPSTTPHSRPDIATSFAASIGDMKWPPRPGSYDENGLVIEAGEVSATFLSLTYEEVRAMLQGVVQGKQPTRHAKHQIYYAFNSLIKVLYGDASTPTRDGLHLKYEDYVNAWLRLFTGSAGDPHSAVGTGPKVVSKDANVASALPLGAPEIPGVFEHQNTDRVNKWRITAGANSVNAGSVVCTIAFGTPYTKNGKPYVPSVASNLGLPILLGPVNVTPSGFSVMNYNALPAATSVDVAFTVSE